MISILYLKKILLPSIIDNIYINIILIYCGIILLFKCKFELYLSFILSISSNISLNIFS